jgi:hypothetical protein
MARKKGKKHGGKGKLKLMGAHLGSKHEGKKGKKSGRKRGGKKRKA